MSNHQSIMQQAKDRGLYVGTVYQRLKRGWSLEDALKTNSESLKDLAEKNGIPYNAFRQRIYGLGWTVEKALSTPLRSSKKYVYNGQEYDIAELEKISKKMITRSVLSHRINVLGWSVERAIETPVEKRVRRNSDKFSRNKARTRVLISRSSLGGINRYLNATVEADFVCPDCKSIMASGHFTDGGDSYILTCDECAKTIDVKNLPSQIILSVRRTQIK